MYICICIYTMENADRSTPRSALAWQCVAPDRIQVHLASSQLLSTPCSAGSLYIYIATLLPVQQAACSQSIGSPSPPTLPPSLLVVYRHSQGTRAISFRPLSDLGFFVLRPYEPFDASGWAEVMRINKPDLEDSASGTWFHRAIGSGIWLRLGRSRDESCIEGKTPATFFQTRLPSQYVRSSRPECAMHNLTDVTLASDAEMGTRWAKNYDTLRRLYWRDRLRFSLGDMARVEIVDFRERHFKRCPPRATDCNHTCGGSTRGHLRAGIGANLSCACDDTLSVLNCGEHDLPLIWQLAKRACLSSKAEGLVRNHCEGGQRDASPHFWWYSGDV